MPHCYFQPAIQSVFGLVNKPSATLAHGAFVRSVPVGRLLV